MRTFAIVRSGTVLEMPVECAAGWARLDAAICLAGCRIPGGKPASQRAVPNPSLDVFGHIARHLNGAVASGVGSTCPAIRAGCIC
jgi:hypothetical protein